MTAKDVIRRALRELEKDSFDGEAYERYVQEFNLVYEAWLYREREKAIEYLPCSRTVR